MVNEGRARGHVTAITALTALPFVLAGIAALVCVWYPFSDWALIELQTADVYSSSPPLVGAYSRLGLNHPGPIAFWLLAPIYVVAGRLPSALLLGTALIGAGSAAGSVRAAARMGGRTFALAMGATLTLLSVCGLRGAGMVDAWNPTLPLLPFIWCGVLGWEVAGGRWRSLPWCLAAGTVAAQSHLAYAAPVATAVLSAVTIGSAGPIDRRRPARRDLLATLAVVVVLWAPPLWQQLRSSTGNLGQLASYVRNGSGGQPTIGWSAALGLLGRVALLGDTGHLADLEDGGGGVVPWPAVWGAAVIAALGIAAALAWRRGSRTLASGLSITTAAAIGSVVGTAGMTGDAFPWLLRPMVALPVWTSGLALWWIGRRRRVRRGVEAWARTWPGPVRGRPAEAALVSLAAVVVLGLPGLASAHGAHDAWSPAVASLCEPAAAALRSSGHATVVMVPDAWADFGFLHFGCMATFARTGLDVRVPQSTGDVLVPGHGPRPGGGVAPAVVVATGRAAIDRFSARPDAVVLSRFVPPTAGPDRVPAYVPEAAVIQVGLGFA